MNLTITVSETGAMTMVADGEAFELALFARSVGKAGPTVDQGKRSPLIDDVGTAPKPAKPPKAKRTSTPTCKTCGGRGHRSNHCPSKAAD